MGNSAFPGNVFSGMSGAVGPTGSTGATGTSGYSAYSGVSGFSGAVITNPCCRVSKLTDQTLTINIDNTITFDAESFDTDNIHSTLSNTSRLTCQTAGRYRIDANGWFGGGNGTYRGIKINLTPIAGGGAVTIAQGQVDLGTAANGYAVNEFISTTYQLVVGDYVEMLLTHNATGTFVAGGGLPFTYFSMERISS